MVSEPYVDVNISSVWINIIILVRKKNIIGCAYCIDVFSFITLRMFRKSNARLPLSPSQPSFSHSMFSCCRLQRWSFFYDDGMVMFFSQGTIAINGFTIPGPSPLNDFLHINHWNQWFFNGFPKFRCDGQRWSFFYNDGMVMFFSQGTIAIDGFSMVLPPLDHHHWMFFTDQPLKSMVLTLKKT